MSKKKGKNKNKRKRSEPPEDGEYEDEDFRGAAVVNEEDVQQDEGRLEEDREVDMMDNDWVLLVLVEAITTEEGSGNPTFQDDYRELSGLNRRDVESAESVSANASTDIVEIENGRVEHARDVSEHLEPSRRTHSLFPLYQDNGEAASIPVPAPEQAYLELLQRLAAEGRSEDARLLAWFIRNERKWMEQASPALHSLVSKYFECNQDILPIPSGNLISILQNEFGVDLLDILKRASTPASVSEEKSRGTKEKEKNPKRGRYNCSICEMPKKDHLCRPTFAQVVAEVKRILKKPKSQRRSRRPSASPPTGRGGNYKCGKCGYNTKSDHDCPIKKVYEQSADSIREKKAENGDLDKVIENFIEASSDFKFIEVDGERIWIPARQVKEDVDDVKKKFRNDGGASDLVDLDEPPSHDAPQGHGDRAHDVAAQHVRPGVRDQFQREENLERLRDLVRNGMAQEDDDRMEQYGGEESGPEQDEKLKEDQDHDE